LPNATTAATHRFGAFLYDARTGELSRDGRTIRLSPRLAAVLVALLDHPGELVEHETLRQRIWPQDTFVDFEHGLAAAVHELRGALGDSAHQPTYIETLFRRGYRWLTPVERVGPATERPVVAFWATATKRPARVVASVAAVVALALAATLLQVSSGKAKDAALAEARRLTARAQSVLWGLTADDSRATIADLRRAIALDPGYAPAYATLARASTNAALKGYLPPRDAYPLANEAAHAAVGLQRGLAAAHVALGEVLFFFEWDPDAAEAELRRARQQAPDDPDVLRAHARFLRKTCRFDEAIAVRRSLLAHDPQLPGASVALAGVYLEAHRFDEAIAVLRPVVASTPAVSSAVPALAAAHAARGDCGDALALADRGRPLLEVEPEDQVVTALLGWVFARCGRREDARATVAAYQAAGSRAWVDPITLASLFAALGDTEEAIRLVERGVEERSPTALSLEFDFMLDPVRRDPRFAAAVDRVWGRHPRRDCGVPGESGR
jgi:DNA-binding winged helix-turn-helix (wHTH) protein/tetratricopeptide (TPR) repeat protein